MTPNGNEQVSIEDFWSTFAPRVRRISRILDGGDAHVEQTLSDVRGALETTHSGGGAVNDLTATAWRAATTSLLSREHLPQGILPRPSPDDPPATRLAQALSALPARKRLAVVLAHQEDLPVRGLADALQCSPEQAETLLAAAEGHLVALVRARGDELDFEPKAHPEPPVQPRRGD